MDPIIIISSTEFKNMRDKLEIAISRNTAGLDDLMIKKMMLTYYRGIYLSDTTIMIEITKKEKEYLELEKLKYEYDAFDWEKGDKDEGKGEDGKLYLSAKGLVSITNQENELVYYPKEVLEEIYKKDYLDNINTGDSSKEEYAKSVQEYLARCYTNGDSGGIQIYAFNTSTNKIVYKYENGDIKQEKKDSIIGSGSLIQVDYNTNIGQYCTPIEFLVNLMEITESKEFVNSVMELIDNDCYINMGLYEISTEVVTENKTECIQDMIVTGKKDNVEYEVKKTDGKTDDLIITENAVTGEEKVNITVTEKNSNDCSVILYKDGVATVGIISLNKFDNWTYTWKNLNKPDQTEKNKEDTGKITITETNTTKESKYDIAIKEVKTWYTSITQSNNTNKVIEFVTKDENRDEITISNKNDRKKIDQPDEDITYNSSERPELFEDAHIYTEIDENSFINEIYNYTIKKPENNYNYQDYKFTKMNIKRTDLTNSILITTTNKTLISGGITETDNTDAFLGLLSNETGTYKKGASFKPKKSGGKVVQYPDLYDRTSRSRRTIS